MPTYEYRREDGTTFEIRQKITAEPLETCPDTGQKVERIITSGAGLIFKGSGFYETDYKDRGAPSENGNVEGKSAGGESETSNSTETSSDTSSATEDA